MKKVILTLTFGVISNFSIAANPTDTLWINAGVDYADGFYTEAADSYKKIMDIEGPSWELYYNLGSAYFKGGELGKAILCFERASRLNPTNEDVRHNLEVANSFTKDKIESVPSFFLVEWLASLRDMLMPNVWTILLILASVGAVAGCVGWFALRRRKYLIMMLVFLAIALICYGFAHSAYSRASSSDEAIVMNSAAVVRSSPDRSGKELFILHEGTKVEIEDEMGEYSEVSIASGSMGWILSQDIEVI